MVKVEAIIEFNYAKYDKIKNLQSKGEKLKGKIFKGDIFDIEDKEAEYLTGNNDLRIVAVKILEKLENTIQEKEKVKDQLKKRQTKKKENK